MCIRDRTISPGPMPTSVPSGILIHPAVWPQYIWTDNWGCCAPFRRGAGSPSKTYDVAWAETYLHTKWHLDPFNLLTTTHQRHRQDRQTGQTDNGPIALGEPSRRNVHHWLKTCTLEALHFDMKKISILISTVSVESRLLTEQRH